MNDLENEYKAAAADSHAAALQLIYKLGFADGYTAGSADTEAAIEANIPAPVTVEKK